MPVLDDEVQEEISIFCHRGDRLVESGNYARAIQEYEKALSLIPEPRYDYAQSVSVYLVIGNAHFLGGQFEKALNATMEAIKSVDGLENPFLHLRLGQSYYEMGLADNAAQHLTLAYAAEGEEIFMEDDPKYFNFLKTKIDIAPPKKKRWWHVYFK